MKKSAILLIFIIPALLQFCKPAATINTSAVYDEDLSIYRTDYAPPNFGKHTLETEEIEEVPYVVPTHSITSELDTVISRIIESRKNIRSVDGFSVQLYAGNSRDKANQIKVKSYTISEDLRPRVSYNQPNYKVRVGQYYSRIEANADLVLLKKHFSRAVLVPVKIRIED